MIFIYILFKLPKQWPNWDVWSQPKSVEGLEVLYDIIGA